MTDKINMRFQSALNLLSEGKLDESVVEWHELLQLDPNCIEARYNLGAALQQKGDLAACIQEYQQVLKITPNDIDARHGLAIALSDLGDFDAALRNIEELIKIAPEYAQVRISLGTVLLKRADKQNRQEDWTAAKEAYETALYFAPNASDALYGLGITLWHFGHQAEGMERVQSAVAIDPAYEAAFSLLYWMQWRIFWRNLRTGRGKQSVQLLKRILHQRRLPHPAKKGQPTMKRL